MFLYKETLKEVGVVVVEVRGSWLRWFGQREEERRRTRRSRRGR